MMDGFSRTPRYVLMHDRIPAGPSVMQTSEVEVIAVFGFSSKPLYDAFLSHSPMALTPYPLVKGYLQRQVDLGTAVMQLVVLDANGPQQLNLPAATARAIVESLDLKRDEVEVSHELIFDDSSGCYQAHSLAVS